ncbi:MAG: TetR/AcrR family transcriptional regulator [Acidimicrobiales bacterium]|nr:TetR/AcrR family transcriptional regulator [Acidimicrobiales bacterium]
MSASRKRLSAGERRSQLIDIGRRVFAEKGYDGASVEEIAERAKISKPVVYEHFGGKEGLYAVVVDREMEYVIDQIGEAISQGEPRERLEGAVLAFLEYVKDRPDGFAVLHRDAPANHGLANLLAEVGDRVGEVFASEFKAAGYDRKAAPIYAQALIGMITFVAVWWRENPKIAVDEVAAHLAALGWMGLRHLPKKPDKPSRRTD